MKRPGPVGLTVLLAFLLVAVIEFRTLLGILGFEVPPRPYFAIAAVLIALLVAGLSRLPEDAEGNPSRT